MTRNSHDKILEDWNIPHPMEELKDRMQKEANHEDDPCVQGRALDSLLYNSFKESRLQLAESHLMVQAV